MTKLIKDVYADKGQYLLAEEVKIVVEFNKLENNSEYNLKCVIRHFNRVEKELKQKINTNSINQSKEIIMNIGSFKKNGYGVEVEIYKDNTRIERKSTAFDIVKNHNDAPRYGFLSDFYEEDQNDNNDIIQLTKLHINRVQFYDWMYRHEDLVAKENIYTDLMGKKIYKNAIINKIRLCHERGMKAMAYGAIYAASKPFYEEHKDWVLKDSSDKPIKFIDIFYIMNIQEKCPWHNHIIEEYAKTIEDMDFDGIHMDTYGFPKKGISQCEGENEIIYLDEEIPKLINNTKERLKDIKKDVTLIFNNVGNWPVKSTATSDQDIIYIEVWEPYTKYHHLKDIIVEAKQIRDKPVILAAYLKPFISENYIEAGYALKLATAAIIANGGYHLVLGEDKCVLTQGYYSDYFKLEDELFEDMRRYYDFAVRYSDLFYSSTLKDVSMTHSCGDNKEYIFEGADFSPCAEENKIWTIIKEDKNKKVISLINLLGNNDLWNKGKKQPNPVSDIVVKIQIEKEVKSVYTVSPEKCVPCQLEYEVVRGERGQELIVRLSEFEIWLLLVVE